MNTISFPVKVEYKDLLSIMDNLPTTKKNQWARVFGMSIALREPFLISQGNYLALKQASYSPRMKETLERIFGKEYPKDGTPLLINYNHGWFLRYSDGNGGYYKEGNKKGITASLTDKKWMVLDINNLP
jgi:hypothetical protein